MRSALRRTVAVIGATAVTASLSLVLSSGPASGAAAIPRFRMPKIYGTTFQPDPKHDFSRLSPRRNGILRGWVTSYANGRAVYEPIRWVKDKYTEGYFAGPPKGRRMAYRSRVAPNAKLYSALDCNPARATRLTVDRRGLGNKPCSRKVRDAYLKRGRFPSMITVYRGRIVRIQEIFRP